MPPKTISVVGFKNSGKTSVVEALVKELTSRGHRVGTLKHTADDISLDTPGKDTTRHREAGSLATGILQENTGAFFIDDRLTIQEAAAKLGPVDYLVIEGFKTVDTHVRILVPREDGDIEALSNGLEIAVVKIPDSMFTGESFTLEQIAKTADLVEASAYPMLPGIDCHTCGYPDCLTMGKELLKGKSDIEQCVGYGSYANLTVNGVDVAMGGFVRDAMVNIISGFVKTLKGGETAKTIKITLEVNDDE